MYKYFTAFVALAAGGNLLIGAPATAQPATPPAAPPNVAAVPHDVLQTRVDAYMRAAVANEHFTGAVLVARDGVPLIDTAYGMANYELSVPNTPQTVFHVASISKQFTAMAIMQLRDRGKLEVSDPICKFLVDCPAAWKPVTIRDLLTHTSGINNVSSLPEWDEELSLKHYGREDFVDLFRGLPLKFTPGEKYSYSNSGYFLLGLIIERVSGSNLDSYLKSNIFGPLDMTQSGYDDNRGIVPNAAAGYYSRGTEFIKATYVDPSTHLGTSGVVSTTGDLLRWDQALYTEKLVSRRSLDEMLTPFRNGYGYGWEIGTRFGRKTIAHSGSDAGFSSYILRFPDERLTVIILGNGDRMSATRVAINLSAIVLDAPYKLPTPELRDELWDVLTRDGIAAATALFDQTRQQTPVRADANGDTLLNVGYELLEARRLDEAEAIFRLGLRHFPELAYAWDGLADSAAARNDKTKAIDYFERSLTIDPSNEYAEKGLAKLRRLKN